MKSLAIIRATDILRLKSILQEMNNVGLTLDGRPKEINIASTENILSEIFDSSDRNYEICVLIPLNQDHILSQTKLNTIPHHFDVAVLDNSNEIFKFLTKMMPALPDLAVSSTHIKTVEKKEKIPRVYISTFVDKKVLVETVSDSKLTGILKNADHIGVFLELFDSSPIFITWHDIKKIIIPKDENMSSDS